MKLLSLISGGIDSPVASKLMKQKGHKLEYLFFVTSEEQLELVEKIVKHLEGKRLFLLPHSKILRELIKNCPRNLQCILCRRMMFRIASEVALDYGHKALVTGENLAQVASQTLPNLILEHEVSKIPILQPLLCMEKQKIVNKSSKANLFQFSKEHQCCGSVPPKPRTHGRKQEIKEAEDNLNIEKIIKDCLENTKIMKFE